MLRIWKLAIGEWQRMLVASFFAFLATASSIGLMYCSGFVLTYAALKPSIAVLAVPIVALRAFGLSRGAFRWMDRIVAHDTALRLLERFRIWFYQKLEPLVPIGLRHIQQGDLFQALARDVDSLEYLYARVVSPVLVVFWTSILMIFLLIPISWKMLFAFLSFQYLAVFLSLALLPYIRNQATSIRALAATLQEIASDLHMGKQQLRIAGTETAWKTHFISVEKQHSQAVQRLSFAIHCADSIIPFLTSLTVLVLAWIGAPMVLGGHLRSVEWVAILLASWAAFESVQGFPALAHALQQSETAGKRLLAIADTPAPSIAPRVQQQQNALVKWENLGFRWPDGEFLFRNWSQELVSGRTYALVGPSGIGKSTLANILCQFLPPSEGQLSWDEMSSPATISFLDQHPHFFTGTMADNLQFANPTATEQEMDQILASVGLGKASQWIGEQGRELSGGQRQRLAAARVLLRNSRLVVLDEPAAHLDTQAEEALLKTFITQAKLRPFALLVITHRPQFLNLFDEILKLSRK